MITWWLVKSVIQPVTSSMLHQTIPVIVILAISIILLILHVMITVGIIRLQQESVMMEIEYQEMDVMLIVVCRLDITVVLMFQEDSQIVY